MLNQSEQASTSTLNDRLEDLKKITKQYQKYTQESQQEFESHFKKYAQYNKQFSGQISLSLNDPISLGSNLSEFMLLFEGISKTKTLQLSEFSQFFISCIEQYNEKMNIYTKIITDGNFSQSQQLAQSKGNYKKAKEKYDKLCKEIELNLNSSKKHSEDVLTVYDLNLSQKNDLKLKELVKQVEPAEQQYKVASEQLEAKIKEFDQAIDDSNQQLVQAHQLTFQRFIEITMKLDQHKLAANNWIKGQIEEKQEKIISIPKLDSEAEDKILTLKYEQDNQQRYLTTLNKILEKKPITDLEYLQFPEILHKHIDAQLQLINERIKNQKILPSYLTEVAGSMDAISKNLLKSIKLAQQFVQDRSDKDKLNFIKPILQVEDILLKLHDGYSKRYNQQSQFILLKAQCLDSIIKDQKNQEKSFMNMYQKMLKDFQVIRQQIAENENKPAQKEVLIQQLKKSIIDNGAVIKFSIDQVRANEIQRSTQIIQTIEQVLVHYGSFIDETIALTKQQEEILNQILDKITKGECKPILQIKADHQFQKFAKLFELTEEIRQKIDTVTLIQSQEEKESEDINLEEGSVKVSQGLIEKFRIQDGDKCLASYACAFENKILLQGRMYIFNSKICFHSYFNGKTLFGTTALGIPAADIQCIKRVKSYMVDAALEFKTTKGTLVFASLSNRERTVQNLKQVKGLENGIIEDKIEQETEKSQAQVFVENNQQQLKPQEKTSTIRSPSPKPIPQSVNETNFQNLEASNEKKQSLIQSQSQTSQIIKQDQQEPSQIQQSQVSSEQKVEQSQIPVVSDPKITQNEPQQNTNPSNTQKQVQEPQIQQQLSNQKQSEQQSKSKQKEQPINPAVPIVSNFEAQNDEQADNNLYTRIIVKEKSQRFMNQANIQKFKTELQVSVKEFIEYFLFDTPYENHLGFPHYYQMVLCKDREVDFQKYQPQPQIGQISKRPIKFIHPVKEKQMFAPDVVHCFAEDVLYYFSDEEILIEKEVKFAKIPYADSFCCRVFWHILTIPGGCQVNYGFYIHFIKSTVFKGKIESGSKNENTDVWEKCLKQVYEEGQHKIIAKRKAALPQNVEIQQEKIEKKDEPIIEQRIPEREKQITNQQEEVLQQMKQESQSLLQEQQQQQQQNQTFEQIKTQQIKQNEFVQQIIPNNEIKELTVKIEKLTQLAYIIIGMLAINLLFSFGK